MSADELRRLEQALPENHRRHLQPGPMAMMAAKGMAPLPPREMVIVLAGLGLSDNAALAETAVRTLAELPPGILRGAIDAQLPELALRHLLQALVRLGQEREDRTALLTLIALDKNTGDDAIALMAPTAPEEVVEIIANNQERCLRSAPIVDGVRKNPSVLRSTLDRLFDFLVRSAVIHEEMPEYDAALSRLSPAEFRTVAEQIELPETVGLGLSATEDETPEVQAHVDEVSRTLEDKRATDEERKAKLPMLKLISSLSMAQKIAFGYRGNKEVRTILLRSSSRMIATAAIRNPRITDNEILSVAKSKAVHDDVIRAIATSKEMSRPYAVKRELVKNPKTPQGTAIRFLVLLRANDVRDIARSKNVPSAVASQARRLVSRRKKG